MSAERPSLLDDDSDGYGEDSVRELTDKRPRRSIYLSPKEIRFHTGQVRKVTVEHEISYEGETPMRKMSRMASQRLTPVKTRLHQCRALIRPLYSRYYPLIITVLVLIAGVASAYLFGATPSAVSEKVLQPAILSMGDAATGMKDKMGTAYAGVRESVEGAYSEVKETIEKGIEAVKRTTMVNETEASREKMEKERESERVRVQTIEHIIRREVAPLLVEMGSMRQTQEAYADWSSRQNERVAELESKMEGDTQWMRERLDSFETTIRTLKMEMEEKMRAQADSTPPPAPISLEDYVTLEEYRMHLENTKKEMARLRRAIATEEQPEQFENLASYINGATIIDSGTTYSLYSSFFNLFSVDRSPLFLLTERQLFPGDCMPLPATGGSVAIRLSGPGHLSHIEYYHLHWSEAGGIPFSAPKHIKITGCTDEHAMMDCETVAECEYTVESTEGRREEARRRRIFGVPIECPLKANLASKPFKSIRFEVESNHGAEHTCLYLTRVLGKAV